mmetsp:Transcript_16422/g.45004  ORF Transcript_16422/g.45004 Transcript_16422/m.45004 type:complete len:326 (+) Transcript_16422:2092-3069(+)
MVPSSNLLVVILTFMVLCLCHHCCVQIAALMEQVPTKPTAKGLLNMWKQTGGSPSGNFQPPPALVASASMKPAVDTGPSWGGDASPPSPPRGARSQRVSPSASDIGVPPAFKPPVFERASLQIKPASEAGHGFDPPKANSRNITHELLMMRRAAEKDQEQQAAADQDRVQRQREASRRAKAEASTASKKSRESDQKPAKEEAYGTVFAQGKPSTSEEGEPREADAPGVIFSQDSYDPEEIGGPNIGAAQPHKASAPKLSSGQSRLHRSSLLGNEDPPGKGSGEGQGPGAGEKATFKGMVLDLTPSRGKSLRVAPGSQSRHLRPLD